MGKRTEATVAESVGPGFRVTKGAPQVVMGLCSLSAEDAARADAAVEGLAAKGSRTLGVARQDGQGAWIFCGISLPVYPKYFLVCAISLAICYLLTKHVLLHIPCFGGGKQRKGVL